jgi:hypothetical protein
MAATFNGTSAFVTLPSGFFNYEHTQPWSFAVRVYPNATRSGAAAGYCIMSRIATSGLFQGIEIELLWTGTNFAPNNKTVLSMYIISNAGTLKYIHRSGSTDLQNSTWYSVCVTYSGSGLASGVKLYVSGARETETTQLDALTTTILNSATPRMGSRTGGSRWFKARMADVGAWDVELTADEVASLGDGFSARMIRPQSLVLCAPMVRELIDLKSGALTNSNMAVSDHPRVYA